MLLGQKALLHELATASFVREAAPVLIVGAAGTGKTHLAHALGYLDDFGLKPLRTPSDEDLHEIIDERYEREATMVTSNLDVSEWSQAFASNQLIAVATIDRLRNRAYTLTLKGKSWRTPRAL